jgi:hypothetical protein
MAPDRIKSQAEVVATIRAHDGSSDLWIELGPHGWTQIRFQEGLWALVHMSVAPGVSEAASEAARAAGEWYMPEDEAALPRSPGPPDVSHTDREQFLLLLDACDHVGWQPGPWDRRD